MSSKTCMFTDSSLPAKLLTANKVKLDFWNESLGINESILLEEKRTENGSVAFFNSDGITQPNTYIIALSSSQSGGTVKLQAVQNTNTNVTIAIDTDLLPTSGQDIHLNFRITCITNEVQKLDHTYYEVPDWNAGSLKEGYIKNKPFGVEEYEGVFWELAKPQFEYMQDTETGDAYYMSPEIYFDLSSDILGKFYNACMYSSTGSDYGGVDSVSFVIEIPTLENPVSIPLSPSMEGQGTIIFNGSSDDINIEIDLVPNSSSTGYMNIRLAGDPAALEPIVQVLASEGSIALDGAWDLDNPIPYRYLEDFLNELPFRVIKFNGDQSIMTVSEIIEAMDNDNAILAVYNNKTYILNQVGTAEAGSVWTFSCGTNSEEFTVVSTGGVAYLVREYDAT